MKTLSVLSIAASLITLWLTHSLCSPILDNPDSEFMERLPCVVILVLHIYLAGFCTFITFRKSPFADWLSRKEKQILED